MIIIFVRALILYILILLGMRFMGKGELTEMQPYELVVILMIAELAVLPMENLGIPFINGVIAIATLVFLQTVISYINLKSNKFREIICGRPSIVIHKGKINEKELKKLRINVNDLMSQLRSKDYFYIDDIDYAILETNGDLSVLPKVNKRNVAVEDLNLQVSDEGLPVSLIIDGKIDYKNLNRLNISINWIYDQLKMNGIKDSKEVLFSYIGEDKKLFIQKKE